MGVLFVKTISYDDIRDLSPIVLSKAYDLNEDETVAVIGDGSQISVILKELLKDEKTYIDYVELENDSYSTYCLYIYSDFAIDVCLLDDREHDDYDEYRSEYVFIFDDCSSRLLGKNTIKNPEVCAFEYIDDEVELAKDDESDKEFKDAPDVEIRTYVDNCTDEEMHGFNASKTDGNVYKSCSFYSSLPLNSTAVNMLLDRFGF